MHTARQIAQQIARWNLVKLDQIVVERPSDDPEDDVIRVIMVRSGTGVRSNRFRNRRAFRTTNRELMKIEGGDRMIAHPRYPLGILA